MCESFVRQRLHALLVSQAFGAVATLVVGVADMVVAGNIVGVDALAGIAAVLPVVIGAQFVARLVYCGAGYLFARYQGLLKPDEARRIVGLSLETAVVAGLLILVVTVLGRDLYLDAMGLSGPVREQAVLYWRWIFVFYALFPLMMTMQRLVYADGETVSTAVAAVLSPLSVVLSIVFTKLSGTAAGSALGVLVSGIVTSLVMMTHLLRKSNAVIPIWNFSWQKLRTIVSYSLTDSISKLSQCGLVAVVGRLVVFTTSTAYLPVVGMVVLVQQLCDLLDGIGEAYMPIAAMYRGERNMSNLRDLAGHALTFSIAAGVLMMVVVEAFAPQIVALYGILPGPVFDSSVIALRISAMAFPLTSVLLFLGSHYLVLDRIGLSLANTLSTGFLLTAACATACCLIWGLDAMWIGLPAGGLLTFVAVAIYCRTIERRSSLLLIPADSDDILNVTFAPVAQQIVRARDRGEKFLRGKGVADELVVRIMLLVEECAMSVADVSRRPHHIRVEASFIVAAETVSLVLRDTGVVRDVTAEDAQVTSLRSFVVAGLMRSYENRRYLSTIGCNRAVFSVSRVAGI